MPIYEIILLGEVTPSDLSTISQTITGMLVDFSLGANDLAIRTRDNVADRSIKAATVGAFFAGHAGLDADFVSTLIRDGVPVIPVVKAGQSFEADVPSMLRPINGLRLRPADGNFAELASVLLECLGLLRRQRRVFVSYRRTESDMAAIQLFDRLSARGFTVFLDTHSIRPGENFQDELWHQMCDCDVVIMLDTKTYFESRWTREEISKARAKDLQVLRVIWPALIPNRLTDMSETLYLAASDLDEITGPLIDARIDDIAIRVESLRSRSIAMRHQTMAGKLQADIERIGGTVEGIGAHRAISLRLLNGRKFWAYPVVGIPTAETVYDIHIKAANFGTDGTPVLVYDHVGMRDAWANHLVWLGEQIPAVRWVKVAEAAWAFAGMED